MKNIEDMFWAIAFILSGSVLAFVFYMGYIGA